MPYEINGLYDQRFSAKKCGAAERAAPRRRVSDASDACPRHPGRLTGGPGASPETKTYQNLLTGRDVYKREGSKTTKKSQETRHLHQ